MLSQELSRKPTNVSTSPWRIRRWAITVIVGTAAAALLTADNNPKPADWPMFGQNISNSGGNPTESSISASNVGQLKTKWTFTTGGDVSARAAVVNGLAYFPDWGGNLWALNANNGKLVWSHQLSDYGLGANTHSRTSPAVIGGVVYVGTQEGAFLLAINASTGALIWKTQVETVDPYAMITASPTVYNGVIYTGVASNEEGLAGFLPGFQCCSARGSAVAVNAATGAILWKTYMTPVGYSGAGVWGSNPVVDAASGTVFVGTGNNYSHPNDAAYLTCISNGGTAATCSSPDNHVDSIVALNLATGTVKWATKLANWGQQVFGVADGSDDWNVSCFVPPFANCPSNAGPDYDFASAPNLITYQTATGPKTILGAGQKSGNYFALDPATGAMLWQTQVGPGSSLGGMEWGSATDGKRIYVSIANFYGIPTAFGSAGSWAALDPATGVILWQRADPNVAIDLGPLSVANGVLYAPSMAGSATAPTMLALDAATGKTLWSFAAGSSVNAGATIVNGIVYWGSGYAHLGIPGYTTNNKFYAFSKNGN
jgi:polyvinyl alcohol dehydrogenase (cytochrome)